ncbi:uncharacterized protein LODBEIA_P10460 [Lodderomyces beijingensis]|uniref:Nucleoporin n=1 Tax=Lodderomyces beijingensis TaxID=1775926 RepID=A0ABP0ZF85_9ASCO
MSLQWSPEAFAEIYNALKFQPDLVDLATIELSSISDDLEHVLTTPTPSQEARGQLKNAIKLSNGDEVQLNDAFVEISVVLATELDLDEVCTAELLYAAQDVSFKKGTSLSDSAKLSYFLRDEYILNILGFLISQGSRSINVATVFANVIASFKKIYKLTDNLNDLIDKQKVSGDINNLGFINGINFARVQLFKCHELLGSILFSFTQNYFDTIGTLSNYKLVIDLVKSLSNKDLLVVHFLPFVLNFHEMAMAMAGETNLVNDLYKYITGNIPMEKSQVFDLSSSKVHGFEILTGFTFLTGFIRWCKKQDSPKYDFQESILKYMEQLIGFGVMELLLCYCAETTNQETRRVFELPETYDFRSLLQKNIPQLEPTKFVYPGTPELINVARQRPGLENVKKLTDVSSFLKLNPELNEALLAPFFQKFFGNFVSNAALILTSLRDSEEDFLLSFQDNEEDAESSEDEDEFGEKKKSGNSAVSEFDQVAQRSDLGRFYIAFAYTFNNRPQLCSLFWDGDNNDGQGNGDNDDQGDGDGDDTDNSTNDVAGFFSWGLCNNSSPLIVATFSVLIGSLASAGSSMAIKIWDVLINNNSSMKKNEFSRISIDSIHDSLEYYVQSLKRNFEEDLAEQLLVLQKKHELIFSSSTSHLEVEGRGDGKIIIELAEDSVVSIAGFMHLLSSIFKHLTDGSDREKHLRAFAYQKFIPIVTQFLEFDNLINGGKMLQVNVNANSTTSNPRYVDLPEIHASDDSRAVLLNLVFRLLGNFVEQNNNSFMRYEIWRLVDRWMYHGMHMVTQNQSQNELLGKVTEPKKYTRKRSPRMIEVFANNLTHYSQVVNFVDLVRKLSIPFGDGSAFAKYTLAYPCDLGYGYRPNNQIGIWPYFEFLMLEVFAQSHELANEDDRRSLQHLVLSFCNESLKEIDWTFLSETAPKIIRNFVSFDSVFDSLIPGVSINFDAYVKLHHSVAIISYFFDSRANTALFKIVNLGVESVNSSPDVAVLVSQALAFLASVQCVQTTYMSSLLPVLKGKKNSVIQHQPTSREISTTGVSASTSLVPSLVSSQPQSIFDNIYLAKGFLGPQGSNSFFDIFLFHISSVVHIALYVSCEDSISTNALKLLQGVAHSAQFKNPNNKISGAGSIDRLLAAFENIDESEKIRFAFIDKFEEVADLQMKYEILSFLSSTLDESKNKITVVHFLLGYEIRGGRLFWNSEREQKHNTLLQVLTNTLKVSLSLISELDFSNGNRHSIDVGPAKLSSMILETLIKLCTDPVSANLTMSLIRDHNNDLVQGLITFQPKLDLQTIWCGYEFDGNLGSEKNSFINSVASVDAFISFIRQREFALKLLSMEFYNINSIAKKKQYASLLIEKNQFPSTLAKILDFLDVLNYIFSNFDIEKYDYLNKTFDMSLVLKEVEGPDYSSLNYSILNKTFRILCQSSNLITPEAKQSYSEEIMVEATNMHEFVTKYLVMTNSREVQLYCLQSWCQLMKILITDHEALSSEFIIETFNSVVPKVSAYLDADVIFSEELISLCASLFDIYCKKYLSSKDLEEKASLMAKLMPLYQCCVSGIIGSNSTPSLRAELYSVFNRFLLQAFANPLVAAQLVKPVKHVYQRLLPVICNDLSYSEGLARINATFALHSLLQLGNITNTDIISVGQTSFLSQILRSLRRTDDIIVLASKNDSDFSLNDLFVELTAFKANIYLLIRIAQTKLGALQLLQIDLLATVRELDLLKIDPDLGLNLYVNESSNLRNETVKILLDTPLSLADLVAPEKSKREENCISYFELVIPIFELIATVLLAMGPSYKPGLIQARSLMQGVVKQLVIGVLKRDYLLDTNQVNHELYKKDDYEISLLKKLVHLFTVINSLTEG